MKLRIGLSPCPNDTFIFHALVHGLVGPPGLEVEAVLADVEELNERMLAGDLEVTKGSFAAFAATRDRYAVLRTGGALGRGNGPLVVAREPLSPDELGGKRILVPGLHTTAALLLRTFHSDVAATPAARYDQVVPALERGEADAAVIIHELRFTYRERGLHAVCDLGARFEQETGLPVPLGGIFVRRDALAARPALGRDLESWIAASLEYARTHPSASREFVREHAQELADEVTAAHIALYVNDFSLGYGEEGERAIERLLALATAAGSAAEAASPVFA